MTSAEIWNARHPIGSPVFVELPDKSHRRGVLETEARHLGYACIAVRVKYTDRLHPKGGLFPISAVSTAP